MEDLIKDLKEKFRDENIKPHDKENVQLAVGLAYADMSRHANGHREEIKNDCVEWLIKEIEKYPDNESSFDAWHETKCKALKNELTNSSKTHKCSFKGTIGRAQKVINMTFKYLLFLDDKKYDSIKNRLHMALDSYTLKWYNRIKSDEQKAFDSWNKINDYTDYKNIQDTIKKYLSNDDTDHFYDASFTVKANNKTIKFNDDRQILLPNNAFEAEFIIWEGEKKKEEYKNVIKTLINYKKDKWFIDEKLDKGLKEKLK